VEILGPKLPRPKICVDLQEAWEALDASALDLVLLDLNLSGEDGFRLLAHAAAGAFHTIVVSANTDQSLRAFEWGVLDFVAKPYTRERLAKALARVGNPRGRALDALAVRRAGFVELVPLDSLAFIRGAGDYTELVSKAGRTDLSDKGLDQLEALLFPKFLRIHRSYLAPLGDLVRLWTAEGSRAEVELRGGERLPVGRSRLKGLREHLG
jgi:DNA-binding LytR/AlgR family response regulator